MSPRTSSSATPGCFQHRGCPPRLRGPPTTPVCTAQKGTVSQVPNAGHTSHDSSPTVHCLSPVVQAGTLAAGSQVDQGLPSLHPPGGCKTPLTIHASTTLSWQHQLLELPAAAGGSRLGSPAWSAQVSQVFKLQPRGSRHPEEVADLGQHGWSPNSATLSCNGPPPPHIGRDPRREGERSLCCQFFFTCI